MRQPTGLTHTQRSVRPGRHRRWFRVLAIIVKPMLWMLTKPRWSGMENIPSSGGVLIVANHVTVVDPLTLAHAIYDGARRIPRYLAKVELFKVPVLGSVLRKSGQIPVYRRSRAAVNSLRDAEVALAEGELVIIYPEGTCTRDPYLWPMVSKTGVARLALACDVPVIPVAHWGAHRILAYKSKKLSVFPRKRVRAIAGAPFDMAPYRGREVNNELLREITDRLMTEVANLLGQLRDEQPPATFFVPGVRTAAKGDTEQAVSEGVT